MEPRGKFYHPPPTCVRPLLSCGGLVSNRSGAVLNCVIAVRKWGEPLQSSGIPAKTCDIAVRNSDIAVRNRDVAVLKWEGGLLKWAPPLRKWGGERPFWTGESLEKVGSPPLIGRLIGVK